MEAVRKPKERTRQPEVQQAPSFPARQRSALGRVLPEAPTHEPGFAPPLPPRERSLPLPATVSSQARSVSPEPEEIDVPEEQPEAAPANGYTVAPSDPPPRYIFPKTNGAVTSSTVVPPYPEAEQRLPSTEPPRSSIEVTRDASSQARPAYPVLDSMPEAVAVPSGSTRAAPTAPKGLPAYSQLAVSHKEQEAWRVSAPIENAPPMYPSTNALETTDLGLLSEQVLLSFYHNELYEASDEFVDRFCEMEERPNGPLFSLLRRYKAVCDDIALSAVEEAANEAALTKCVRDVWMMQQRTATANDPCGENRAGSGTAQYSTATLCVEKLEEMRKLLMTNQEVTLRKRMSQEVEARSLAQQIQWIVISINHGFLAEARVTISALPTLLDTTPPGVSSGCRLLLRSALSDLFFHLRLPSLPKPFADAAVGWVTELTCILHKACLSSDGLWLLLHVLRIPSPSSDWTAPLIQTFVQSNSPGKLKMDYCIAMLAQLMNPIKSREKFLASLTAAREETGDSWMIIDDEGEKEHDPIVISETDLTALLDQLPISDFYSLAYLHFSTTNTDRVSQFASLLAFQLLLMKVLHDGLETYAQLEYKQFCKQIGMTLRKSVRELASHWKVARGLLDAASEEQLQREMDRVILLAVHYVISKKSLGLWQFLIDLPFDCISEGCRLRVEYLLRKGGDEGSRSVRELFEATTPEIEGSIRQGGLGDRLESAGPLDTVFLVNALATLVAQSARDPTPFLREVIETCFVDASTRDTLYKVGGEAIATIIGAKPATLDSLLTIIDRNIDHMEDHAVDIFASAPLNLCKVGESVVGGVIGKWLIARSPDRAGNRVARRVLSALNWGYTDEDSSGGTERLWMGERVHAVAADTVLKAHLVHCTRSNGLIAKSVQKIAKLASKIPDHEQHFSQFCWDILLKLKLTIEPSTAAPEADLAAYFVHAAKHSLASPEAFAENGLSYVGELVNAGCTSAAAVLLERSFALHHARMESILGHKNFLSTFERVLHSDQCSYAYQLLAGPSSAPTPLVRLLSCGIVYDARLCSDLASFLRRWVDALCLRRVNAFAADQVSLQLLGTIVRLAFERDAKGLLGIGDMLTAAYTQQMTAWRESSKGFLSMFSGTPQPPPLIASTHLSVSSWASWALLQVEEEALNAFHACLYDALAKKEKTTLEDAVKKASSKVSYALPIERLPVFRWIELVLTLGVGERAKEREKDGPVLAVSLQRLALDLFGLKTSQGKKYQLARRFYTCATMSAQWKALEESLEAREVSEARGLAKAVVGWVKASVDISLPSFSNYARFDLDYLLQLAVANDQNVWLDFVDLNVITGQDLDDSKLFAHVCHAKGRPLPSGGAGPLYPMNLGSQSTRARPFPSLPNHHALVRAPVLDRSISVQPQIATGLVQPLLSAISKLAIEFVTASEKVEDKDKEYVEQLKNLYKKGTLNINIVVRCGSRCQMPANRTVQVSVMEFNTAVDAAITKNREERVEAVSRLKQAVMDAAAVKCASIEYIASELCSLARSAPVQLRQTSLQLCGRSLFFLLTSAISSVDSSPILFPPATSALENTLRTLGMEFIMGRPEEQLAVMKLVLEGFVLSSPLAESFSPECLDPNLLVEAYGRLSDAVAKPELSQRALLLLSRLSITRATSLPPHQFRPLMPLAFRNVASSSADGIVASPLGQLCLDHFVAFVFHQFPVNFAYGIELTMNGCNAGSTPPLLLDQIAAKVDAKPMEGVLAEYRLDAKTCSECIAVTSRALATSRSQGLSSLFSRWAKYTDALGALIQMYMEKTAGASFSEHAPTSLAEKQLSECFVRCVSLFGPLLSPSQPSLPPFSPSNDEQAGALLDRFVNTVIKLPYNGVLPPGSQNSLSLMWRFYAEQLATLTHGTMHYYGVLESHLVRMPWLNFWPSLRALQAMEEVLSSRSADCAPFVAQIVVRVAWKEVLAQHVPDDLRPSYLSTLFLVLVRLNAKHGNIAKVRASMAELLKSLSGRTDWYTVSVEDVQNIANTVGVILPFDTVCNPTDEIQQCLWIWRKMCGFVASQETVRTDALVVFKQSAYLRAQLALVIRTGSVPKALPAYNNLLSDTSTIAANQGDIRAYSTVARELTAVWTKISDVRLGESLVTGWQSFLSTNPTSSLVLTCMHTLIGSLNDDQLSTALRVMESTLHTYFKRPTSSWTEAAQWVTFPQESREKIAKYLLCTPNSDNKLTPLSLSIRAFAVHGEATSTTFEKLLYYITNLKPKYVEEEAALCVPLALLLQWMTATATRPEAASTAYRSMTEWLKRAAHDERGGGLLGAIGLGKKNAYTIKLRTVLQVLELYLVQQRQSGERSPELRLRRAKTDPVMNGRIAAFKELAGAKTSASFSAAFASVNRYFTVVESHHIEHSHLLLLQFASGVFGHPRYLES